MQELLTQKSAAKSLSSIGNRRRKHARYGFAGEGGVRFTPQTAANDDPYVCSLPGPTVLNLNRQSKDAAAQ